MVAPRLETAIKVIIRTPECENCRSRSFNLYGMVEDIPEFGAEIFLAPLFCIDCGLVLRYPVNIGVLEKAISNDNVYKFDIVINDLPKTINQISGKHWSVIQKESKKWFLLIKNNLIAKQVRLPDEPLKKARIVYTRHSSRQCDHDNLISGTKKITDCLVRLRILDDDNPNVIETVHLWEKCAPGKGRIRIQVNEVRG